MLYVKIGAGVVIFFAVALVILHLITLYEKRHLKVSGYTIRDKRLPISFQGKKLVFLSDLHNAWHGADQTLLLEKIKEIDPDLVCIGGDMMVVKGWSQEDFSPLLALLDGLCPHYPVIYADGNHEQRMKERADRYPGWYQRFVEGLQARGVIYLQDETVALKWDAQTGQLMVLPVSQGDDSCVLLSGLSLEMTYYQKLYFVKKLTLSQAHLQEKLPRLQEKTFHILMAHTPHFVEAYAKAGADLVLSGHYHGGCVRLPMLGSVVSPQLQLFPRYAWGYKKKEQTHVVVSAGLGTHSVNIRVNNPPELVVLSLECEAVS